jgi:hypothetical protein
MYGVEQMYEVILKRFEAPDEVRVFEKGRFELVYLGGMTIGRAIYEPGWKWSTHVGSLTGGRSCEVAHVGLVVAGSATAAMDDGRIVEMKEGDLFYISPGHDSWVVGDQPYVSLHFMGATDYAQSKPGRQTRGALDPSGTTECLLGNASYRSVESVGCAAVDKYPDRGGRHSNRRGAVRASPGAI